MAASSTATFERMIASNLRGPWLMCHHLGPRLRDGASVVLVGSNIGLRAIADSAAYSVAKAGVHMLARVLALEWARPGHPLQRHRPRAGAHRHGGPAPRPRPRTRRRPWPPWPG